jgi:hypothetical protein
MSAVPQDYVELLAAFAEGGMDARLFERAFLEKFKSEQRTLDPSTFQVLDELFADVDAFVDNARLRGELEVRGASPAIEAAELRDRAASALTRLRS